MSKVCQFTGKRPSAGNTRSKSLRATRRTFNPSVAKRTIIDPVTGKKIKVKISTHAQKTFLKNPSKFKAEIKTLVKKAERRAAKKPISKK